MSAPRGAAKVRLTVLIAAMAVSPVLPHPASASVTRTAPYDSGTVCYVYGNKLPPEGPSDSHTATCATYPPPPGSTASKHVEKSPAFLAYQGRLTAGGWDYLYLPEVRSGYLASVQRASATVYRTASASGDITVTADISGYIGGTPSSFSRRLKVCLFVRDPSGARYSLASDCFWKDEAVRDLSVTKAAAAGETVWVEVQAEATGDVGAAAVYVESFSFSA